MKSQNQDPNRLDEKSLHILSRIDESIHDQYRTLSEEPSSHPSLDFSSSYEKRKAQILQGKSEGVEKELRHKKVKVEVRKWGLPAAVLVIIISLITMGIRHQEPTAGMNRFGSAIVQTYPDHTEFYYKEKKKTDPCPTHLPLVHLEDDLPEGYQIIESDIDSLYYFKRFQNAKGQWLDLTIQPTGGVVGLDTENALHTLLKIEGVPVNKYVHSKATIYFWEYQDLIYTFSGNASKDMETLVPKIIHKIK